MADNLTVKISGMDDLKRVLSEIPEQMRKKVILGALRKAARVPLQIARREVPIMSAASAAKNPYRTAGLLRKRLTVRVSKESRKAGNLGVFINIKPAAGAKYSTTSTRILGAKIRNRTLKKSSDRGAKSPNDPYYWRFVEFGTSKMAAKPFLKPAGDSLGEALNVFLAEVVPQLEKWNKRK
jgi:HK97 gp10 family phage protein